MKEKYINGIFIISILPILILFLSSIVLALKPQEYVQGEVIVKFKHSQNMIDSAFEKSAQFQNSPIGELKDKYNIMPKKKLIIEVEQSNQFNKYFKKHGVDRTYLLSMPRNTKMDDILRELRNNPNIEYAEPNYIVQASLVPNDPNFNLLYGLNNAGQTGGAIDADIDAPESWDIQKGSSNVVVAVIDTGVDYAHEDLAANIWTNTNEIPNNGIDDDNNGYIDDVIGWDFVNHDNNPIDDYGHGTHVSGTVGAVGNNGKGVVGVNWNIKIMPLKFLDSQGSGTIADAVLAIQYATLMGADIMSNSWGGGGYSQALKDAISAANDAGILFVAAAGNSNNNNDINPNYPSNYDVPNVIAVAATDHNDLKASFSNYGPATVDLGAPGVSVYSTVPNGSCLLCNPSGYKYLSGTSMATPHVSGVAALIKGQYPLITYMQIKSRLLNSVDKLPSMAGITLSGGRLNAFRALENDSTPPAPVSDLTSSNNGSSSITLTWTAVGDDNNLGAASEYDLRYLKLPIDDTNFVNSTRVADVPMPKASGSTENLTIYNLDLSTTYYFAIKAIDNVGNLGQISNIAVGNTKSRIVLFQDNFESGLNGWTIGGTLFNSTNETSFLWHLETLKYNSPTTSWTYNKGNPSYTYDTGARTFGALISPLINLTVQSNTSLIFYDYYQTETPDTFYDIRFIQISVDDGPFIDLVQLSSDPMNTWHKHELSLNQYIGHNIRLRFYFDSVDSFYNNYWGWSVDDVSVLADNLSLPVNPAPVIPKPDLVILSLATSKTLIAPGSSLSLPNTIKNIGNSSVNSTFYVGFSLSIDNVFGGIDDFKLGNRTVTTSMAFNTTNTATTTLTIPANITIGDYFICAMVDFTNLINESAEDNNALCTNFTIKVTRPDLVIGNIIPNNITTGGGQYLSVLNSVKNFGLVSATPSYVKYSLSINKIYGDSDDIYSSTTRYIGTLASGSSSIANTTILIPTTIKAGNYYACAKADYSNNVPETNESNNAACSDTAVNVPNPDILVSTISTTAAFVAPGSSLSLYNNINNKGESATGSFVTAYHLSIDNAFGGADDITFAANRTITYLNAKSSSVASTTLTVPVITPLGSYFVCAFSDTNNSIDEVNESNNFACTNTTITVTKANLVVQEVIGPITSSRGSNITIFNAIQNQGLASAGQFYVGFYLSTDSNINSSDRLIGSRIISSLMPNAANSANTTISVPITIPIGNYYLGAIADYTNKVSELNENDNAAIGNIISIA